MQDIEDLPAIRDGSDWGKVCGRICKESLHLKFKDGSEWHKVYTISEILRILRETTDDNSYILLAGNTAHGEPNLKEKSLNRLKSLTCTSIRCLS